MKKIQNTLITLTMLSLLFISMSGFVKADIQCDEGQILIDGMCVDGFECAEEEIMIDGECVQREEPSVLDVEVNSGSYARYNQPNDFTKIELQVSVKNNGDTTENIYLWYELIDFETNNVVDQGYLQMFILAPGIQMRSDKHYVEDVPAGNYFLKVKAMYGYYDIEEETDQDNNFQYMLFNLNTEYPEIDVSISSMELEEVRDNIYKAKLKINSEYNIGASQVRVFRNGNLIQFKSLVLEPFGQRVWETNEFFANPGTALTAKIDYWDVLDETNELNNEIGVSVAGNLVECAQGQIMIDGECVDEIEQLLDLIVVQSQPGDLYNQGEEIPFTIRLRNTGERLTTDYEVRLKEQGSNDYIAIDRRIITFSGDYNVNWMYDSEELNLVPGSYTVEVEIDNDNEIEELTELNNLYTSNFNLLAEPNDDVNLAVKSYYIEPVDTSNNKEFRMVLEIESNNYFGEIPIRVTYGNISQETTLYDSFIVSTQNNGFWYSEPFELNTGTYSFNFHLDYNNLIGESTESDNFGYLTYSVYDLGENEYYLEYGSKYVIEGKEVIALALANEEFVRVRVDGKHYDTLQRSVEKTVGGLDITYLKGLSNPDNDWYDFAGTFKIVNHDLDVVKDKPSVKLIPVVQRVEQGEDAEFKLSIKDNHELTSSNWYTYRLSALGPFKNDLPAFVRLTPGEIKTVVFNMNTNHLTTESSYYNKKEDLLRTYYFTVEIVPENNPEQRTAVKGSVEITEEIPGFPENYFDIRLAKGWNLVSVPEQFESFESSSCSDRKPVAFVYLKNKYVTIAEAQRMLGSGFSDFISKQSFWVYSFENCKFKVKQTSVEDTSWKLVEGWNFVPFKEGMKGQSISEMIPCAKSVYRYTNKGWQDLTPRINSPMSSGFLGEGLLVKTSESCILQYDNNDLTPPMPPYNEGYNRREEIPAQVELVEDVLQEPSDDNLAETARKKRACFVVGFVCSDIELEDGDLELELHHAFLNEIDATITVMGKTQTITGWEAYDDESFTFKLPGINYLDGEPLKVEWSYQTENEQRTYVGEINVVGEMDDSKYELQDSVE